MKKQDLWPILVIVALFFAYPWIDRTFVAKLFPAKAPAQKPAVEQPVEVAPTDVPAGTTLSAPAETEPAAEMLAAEAAAPAAETPAAAPAAEAEPAAPEATVELANGVARYVLTTKGAAIKSAAMIAPDEANSGRYRYPLSAKELDRPVAFDFTERPSGAHVGLPFTTAGEDGADFELVASTPTSATFRRTRNGLAITRTITLGDGYQLSFADTFKNEGQADISLHGWGLQAGWIPNLEGEADARIPSLGADTLSGEDVDFWSGKFEKWFPGKDEGVAQAYTVPLGGDRVDWLALKNKYFAQLIHPAEEGLGASVRVSARRGAPVATRTLLIFPSTAHPFGSVAGALLFDDATLAAGETRSLAFDLYVGPKLYQALAANGYHEEDILQLGFWRVIGIWILKLMVWFRDTIWPHNYGLSIILLTLVIRILFWPLNHKSMASTQRMQEIQPQLAAVREKFKNDPQKQQAAMMQLYKDNKINPMGGCLPMLIQIPVFFALFIVLRGAIELRFSSFLWITDLSTPENLFRDQLGFGINILPILMGLTMWWQQRMTPTSDPSQQKMMLMMPILFTVLFYSFPSGLSLYWTTNQVLMIAQLAWMHRKQAAKSAAAPAPSPSDKRKK